jgi:serine/threonine protein kinase
MLTFFILVCRQNGYIGIEDIHISIQGLEYAQLIRDDQPLTGHFGRKYSRYAFTAPEMEDAFVHDARVDNWSLGATMYMVLCGTGPFREDGEQLMLNKLKGNIEFDMVVLSKDAEALVTGLLQARPEDRIGIREVLTHDWITLPDDDLRHNDLEVVKLIFGDYDAE